jgi:hypothetical protein
VHPHAHKHAEAHTQTHRHTDTHMNTHNWTRQHHKPSALHTSNAATYVYRSPASHNITLCNRLNKPEPQVAVFMNGNFAWNPGRVIRWSPTLWSHDESCKCTFLVSHVMQEHGISAACDQVWCTCGALLFGGLQTARCNASSAAAFLTKPWAVSTCLDHRVAPRHCEVWSSFDTVYVCVLCFRTQTLENTRPA